MISDDERALRGVFPIVLTAFREDSSLDLTSQQRLLEHLLESGVQGLGLFGNASESYTLFGDEQLTLLKLAVRVVNGCVPIVVSTGYSGTDGAIALSRQAEDLGASAVMVLPPCYLRPDTCGLLRYYEAISEAIQLPIIVQDAPLMTQVSMPASLLVRMARDIGRVAYAKIEAPPTAPKISDVLRDSDGAIVCFGGLNGQFLIEEHERGARGVMPGSDIAGMYARMWRFLESGRRQEAWQVFMRVLPLIRFELQPGMGVSAMKHNLVAEGVLGCARVRHPTLSLDGQSLRELQTLREIAKCG